MISKRCRSSRSNVHVELKRDAERPDLDVANGHQSGEKWKNEIFLTK